MREKYTEKIYKYNTNYDAFFHLVEEKMTFNNKTLFFFYFSIFQKFH